MSQTFKQMSEPAQAVIRLDLKSSLVFKCWGGGGGGIQRSEVTQLLEILNERTEHLFTCFSNFNGLERYSVVLDL